MVYKNLNKIVRLVGIILFIIFIYYSDYSRLILHFSSVKIDFIFYAIIITPIFFVLKIFRWYFLLKSIGINYSFANATITFGAGLFAGQITPGQIGELIRGVFLGKRGYDYALAIQSVVIDRLLDLTLLFLITIPGIIWYLNTNINTIIHIIIISISIIGCFYFIFKLLIKTYSFNTKSLLHKQLFKLSHSFKLFYQSIKNYKVGFVLIGLTVASLILNLIRFYFILLSLDIDLQILHFIFVSTFAMVAGLLPISIAGIGTREAAYILVFNDLGFSNELAISYSVLILIICYLFNVVWGFPAWLLETK